MRSRIKCLAVLTVVVASSAGAWAAPALAASGASEGRSAPAVSAHKSHRPNVLIKGQPAEFVPQAIKVKGVSGPACTPQHYSFRVTNDTSASQQLEYQGGPYGTPIPPGKNDHICDEDGVNFTMGLESNPDAVLTVTGRH
jgi:hypothetical protein